MEVSDSLSSIERSSFDKCSSSRHHRMGRPTLQTLSLRVPARPHLQIRLRVPHLPPPLALLYRHLPDPMALRYSPAPNPRTSPEPRRSPRAAGDMSPLPPHQHALQPRHRVRPKPPPAHRGLHGRHSARSDARVQHALPLPSPRPILSGTGSGLGRGPPLALPRAREIVTMRRAPRALRVPVLRPRAQRSVPVEPCAGACWPPGCSGTAESGLRGGTASGERAASVEAVAEGTTEGLAHVARGELHGFFPRMWREEEKGTVVSRSAEGPSWAGVDADSDIYARCEACEVWSVRGRPCSLSTVLVRTVPRFTMQIRLIDGAHVRLDAVQNIKTTTHPDPFQPQAVSCGRTISFVPLTLSCFKRSKPSGIAARPPGSTSTLFGCVMHLQVSTPFDRSRRSKSPHVPRSPRP